MSPRHRRLQKSPRRYGFDDDDEEDDMAPPSRVPCWSCGAIKDRLLAFCNNCGAETRCRCSLTPMKAGIGSDEGTGKFCTVCGRARGALDKSFQYSCMVSVALCCWGLMVACSDLYYVITTGKEDRGNLVSLFVVTVVLITGIAVQVRWAMRPNTPVEAKTHPMQEMFGKRVDRMEAVLDDLMEVCKDAATYSAPDKQE